MEWAWDYLMATLITVDTILPTTVLVDGMILIPTTAMDIPTTVMEDSTVRIIEVHTGRVTIMVSIMDIIPEDTGVLITQIPTTATEGWTAGIMPGTAGLPEQL